MRTGMGNLLETDSDVASISDNEKERTDGDGMESDTMGANKRSNARADGATTSDREPKQPDKKTEDAAGTDVNGADNTSSISSTELSQHPSSSKCTNNSENQDQTRQPRPKSASTSDASLSSPFPVTSSKSFTVSPRELPPRNQLIQLKPVMRKPKLSNKSLSTDSDIINKQKNPRFIPYEPYRGAVRPMVAQEDSDTSKKHSRTTSEVSSNSLDQAIGNISLNDSPEVDKSPGQNTQDKRKKATASSSDVTNVTTVHFKKQEQLILKQTHALSLLKERIKIAEKDNYDLHKENIRLKKLLVDSLSGDVIHDSTRPNPSTNESVDALSNEIEVWRSKFLSSCVLVEQLTRENGVLNEAVGSATTILKDVKLSSSLPQDVFDSVNAWIRSTRSTCSPPPNQNNNLPETFQD